MTCIIILTTIGIGTVTSHFLVLMLEYELLHGQYSKCLADEF